MPTIHITNATSRKPPHRGPSGTVWSIMAAPRAHYGELGSGQVSALVPDLDMVQRAKAGTMPTEDYRAAYVAGLDVAGLAHGALLGTYARPIEDGDTLVCACSRAKAAKGECHRVWAAEALREAGWSVVLDGEALP